MGNIAQCPLKAQYSFHSSHNFAASQHTEQARTLHMLALWGVTNECIHELRPNLFQEHSFDRRLHPIESYKGDATTIQGALFDLGPCIPHKDLSVWSEAIHLTCYQLVESGADCAFHFLSWERFKSRFRDSPTHFTAAETKRWPTVEVLAFRAIRE